MSSSKIFTKNRSRIESLDNIGKDDLNDSRSKDGMGFRGKKDTVI